MTDYLLVHGAGQGAWIWGRVWGYMTAPEEHPPRLYQPRRANKVFPLDLPGHGADAGGDTSEVILDECVHSIVRAVERQDLRDLVLVGQGMAGALVLQAVEQLPRPPKRLVLIAGILPDNRKSMLTAFPRSARETFRLLALFANASGRDLKLPKPFIQRYLCNGIDPMQVAQVQGFFGALPVKVLKAKLSLGDIALPCPVSYVVLTEDRVLSPDSQRRMASRISGAEVVELESCHQVTLAKPRELADLLLRYA